MSIKIVPAVVVPGFCGYVQDADEMDAACEPAELLQCLWLSVLEGREEQPGSYLVALPEEGVLVPEMPPDGTLDALSAALPEHVKTGAFHCFVYDWRQDLTVSATRLATELIEHAQTSGSEEIDLISVGPGCLVTRYLLESGRFPVAARLVRRSVLMAAPNFGIPAGLVLLNGLCAVFEPEVALRDALRAFPAAFQLLPPRGTAYLYGASGPGARLEPFSSPEAFLAGSENLAGAKSIEGVMRDAADCNDALHGHLKSGFDPSWRRSLAFASGSEATFCDLHLSMLEGAARWTRLQRRECSGDGVAPILGAVPHPMVRTLIVNGTHRSICSAPLLQELLAAFLVGPMS